MLDQNLSKVIDFPDEFEEQLLLLLFVIETNLQRRQLNNFQRVELAFELEKVEVKNQKNDRLN